MSQGFSEAVQRFLDNMFATGAKSVFQWALMVLVAVGSFLTWVCFMWGGVDTSSTAMEAAQWLHFSLGTLFTYAAVQQSVLWSKRRRALEFSKVLMVITLLAAISTGAIVISEKDTIEKSDLSDTSKRLVIGYNSALIVFSAVAILAAVFIREIGEDEEEVEREEMIYKQKKEASKRYKKHQLKVKADPEAAVFVAKEAIEKAREEREIAPQAAGEAGGNKGIHAGDQEDNLEHPEMQNS